MSLNFEMMQLLEHLRTMPPVINSYATLGHLNVRKVGPDDERVLAFDIKLSEVVISPNTFARVLGCESWSQAEISFWDSEGWRRFPMMGPIVSQGGLHQCIVAMGKRLVLKNVEIRKFKFELRDSHVIEGEFSMTVSDPGENITALLADMVTELIPVSIYETQEELPFTSAAEAMDPEEPLEWLPSPEDDETPPLFHEAFQLVTATGRASAATIQRRLRVGYNQAQRILAELQVRGVVSMEGNGGQYKVLVETGEEEQPE